MKPIVIFFLAATFLAGCTKVEDTRTSGTDTIESTILPFGTGDYQVYGFLFSQAKLQSNRGNPSPDIILQVPRDEPKRLVLSTNNYQDSFHKVGDFADESSAITAFDNIKTVSVSQWVSMADLIAPNQVWIYRTDNGRYTKIRIISTVNEVRDGFDYGECTFQWVYQPDGSVNFP